MSELIDVGLGDDIPELELVPEGEQRLQCIDAEKTTSNSGNPMIHLEFEQPGNELAEEIHHYVTLPLPDDDQKTVIRKKNNLKELLEALGVSDYQHGFDPNDLIGKETEVIIRHEDDPEYGESARIQRFVTPA